MHTPNHAEHNNPGKSKVFYGWIIVIGATLIYTVVEIPVFSFGIFIKPMANEFGWSRGVTTGAFGLYMLMMGMFSILGGVLVDRIGPRALNLWAGLLIGAGLIVIAYTRSIAVFYVGYSVLGGIGFSFVFVPNQTTLARWFVAKRGLALGIMFAGGGMGALIATPLMQACIDRYGWRTAFVILALAVFCIAVPSALLFKKEPAEMGLLPLGESETKQDLPAESRDTKKAGENLQEQSFTLPDALKSWAFWIYNLAITLMFLGFFMAQVNMVPHATDQGVSTAAAALALGIAAGFNAFGRLFMGAVSDKIGTKRSFFICLLLGSMTLFWLVNVSSSWMMYLFAVVFGLAYGGAVPQMPRLVSELFGVKSMGSIMGVSMLITTLGPAFGPVLGGAIYDRSGSYGPAFVTGGVVILMAMLLLLCLKLPQKTAPIISISPEQYQILRPK